MSKPISKEALVKMQKVFGKDNISLIGDGPDLTVDRIPSGSLYLDSILGGGWPLGRIVEIYGEPSSGKSSTCLHLLAEAQKSDLNVAYIDLEATFDPNYSAELGVDSDSVLYSAPENGEQALDIAKAVCEMGEVSVIIIDSTNACVPKSEAEGDLGDHAVGSQARLLSKGMRILTPLAKKHNVLIVMISQIRMSIGMSFGDPRVIGSGKSVGFAASIRLEVSKTKAKEKDGLPYAHTMKFKTVKNKTYKPYQRAEILFVYGKGFDAMSEIVELSTQMEIISKSGSWFKYKDTSIGQGAESVAEMLRDNPELAEELTEQVIEGLKQQ